VAIRSRDKLPYTESADGIHDDHKNNVQLWTNGFWGGLMWMMYDATKNEDYLLTARRAEELLDPAFADIDQLHHDVGFMWHLTAGADFRLTESKAAKNRFLLAAMTLASRFKANGGYIRAWNSPDGVGNNTDGWTIIDTMMNLPLLYHASAVIGDDRFKQIAISHADKAMADHVRPDGSINHIVRHDLETGDMTGSFAGQGYAVGSCWSRGESWALYGYVLSYIYTGDARYLDTAKRVAHYSIANLAMSGWIPLVDFRAPEAPVYYDATAGAIMACGLIEIARAVPEHEQRLYLTAAMNILKALDEKACSYDEDRDALLLMCSEAYVSKCGYDHNIIYGDFFFTEAILKLRGSEFLPW
jgi:unsaturated chondroitin disaccharide hydrolase